MIGFLLFLAIVAASQAHPSAPSWLRRTGGKRNWDDYKSHLLLNAGDVAGKRVLILGDVHGCMGELMDMLRKADMLNAAGTGVADDGILVLAGDFTNKGPRSAEVLRFVRANDNVYAATGNHEINALNNPGGYPWSWELNDAEWDWLVWLPWTVSIPDGDVTVTVTHGGLMPDVPLHDQEEFVLTRMRNLIPNGSGGWIPSDSRDEGYAWASIWSGPYHVVFGHDAGRAKQQEAWATGLDTGCVYGQRLTGIWLPVKEQRFIDVQCETWDP